MSYSRDCRFKKKFHCSFLVSSLLKLRNHTHPIDIQFNIFSFLMNISARVIIQEAGQIPENSELQKSLKDLTFLV